MNLIADIIKKLAAGEKLNPNNRDRQLMESLHSIENVILHLTGF